MAAPAMSGGSHREGSVKRLRRKSSRTLRMGTVSAIVVTGEPLRIDVPGGRCRLLA
jgi:hypothetical protein